MPEAVLRTEHSKLHLGETDEDVVVRFVEKIVGRGTIPPPSPVARAEAKEPRGLLLSVAHHVCHILHDPVEVFAVDVGKEARGEFGIRRIFEETTSSLRNVLNRPLRIDGKDGKDQIFNGLEALPIRIKKCAG